MAANLALVSKGLRVGDRDPVVVQVRQLLAKAGVLANYTVSDPTLFDPGLGQLVQAFQKAKGLQQDGIVGPRTWSLLGGGTVGAPPVAVTPPTQNDVPTQPAPPAGPGGASGFPFMLAAGALAAAAGLYWYTKRKSSSGPGSALSTLSGWLGGPVEDEAARVKRNLQSRVRRHAKERAEEQAAVRAAWELAKRTPDVIGAQLEAETRRLVAAGYRPADAAMRARAQLMNRSPGLPTQARIEATVRAEAERLTPMDPGLTATERAGVERQRRALTEKMMRTGLGPMKNVTKAVEHVRRDPSWNISPGRETAAEIFTTGVRASVQRPIGGKLLPGDPITITVDSVAYANDKAYRESMKDRAKTTSVEQARPVRIVGTNSDSTAGRAPLLWSYNPAKRKSMGRFRDAVTDSLLDEPATLATEGDCEGAVKTLLKRRALPATPREAELQKRVITVVHNRCAPELERAVTAAANGRADVEAQFPSSPLTRAEAKGTGLRAGSRREARVKRDAETRAEEAWWAAHAANPGGKASGRPRGRATKASESTVESSAVPFVVVPKGGTPYYLRTETEKKGAKTYTRRRKVKTTDPRFKTTGS